MCIETFSIFEYVCILSTKRDSFANIKIRTKTISRNSYTSSRRGASIKIITANFLPRSTVQNLDGCQIK